MSTTEKETFKGFCVLELFGHRRLGGYVSEQEIAGALMLRIDIPLEAGGEVTQFYGSAAIYSLTPTTEEAARAVAYYNVVEPVSSWEMNRVASLPLDISDITDEELPF